MFHRSMSLRRVYKSTLRSASSQNLIKATADVIFVSANFAKLFQILQVSLLIFFGGGSLLLATQ